MSYRYVQAILTGSLLGFALSSAASGRLIDAAVLAFMGALALAFDYKRGLSAMNHLPTAAGVWLVQPPLPRPTRGEARLPG